MALASLTQIRQAFKTQLTAQLGTEDQTVSAYVRRNPTLPIVWVRPQVNTPVQYHVAFGAGGGEVQKWLFLVEVYTGGGDEIAAQERLDAYLSPGAKSIYQAIASDITLGNVVKNLNVTGCNAYVEFRRADGTDAIGANWTVEVYP